MKCINIAVIGDGMVGKTCLLNAYTSNTTPKDYNITIFDNYRADITVNNEQIELHLIDTAGSEEYDQLRQQIYPFADAFIMCFSVDLDSSFYNIEEKWVKQLRKAGNKKPVILVATKTDVRNNPENSRHVTREGFFIITKARGMQMAEKIGVPYLECSSLFLEGVNDVFQRAILAALEDIGNQRNKKNKTSCCIL